MNESSSELVVHHGEAQSPKPGRNFGYPEVNSDTWFRGWRKFVSDDGNGSHAGGGHGEGQATGWGGGDGSGSCALLFTPHGMGEGSEDGNGWGSGFCFTAGESNGSCDTEDWK